MKLFDVWYIYCNVQKAHFIFLIFMKCTQQNYIIYWYVEVPPPCSKCADGFNCKTKWWPWIFDRWHFRVHSILDSSFSRMLNLLPQGTFLLILSLMSSVLLSNPVSLVTYVYKLFRHVCWWTKQVSQVIKSIKYILQEILLIFINPNKNKKTFNALIKKNVKKSMKNYLKTTTCA